MAGDGDQDAGRCTGTSSKAPKSRIVGVMDDTGPVHPFPSVNEPTARPDLAKAVENHATAKISRSPAVLLGFPHVRPAIGPGELHGVVWRAVDVGSAELRSPEEASETVRSVIRSHR